MVDQLRQLLDHANLLDVVADIAEEVGVEERYVTWLRAVASRPKQRHLSRGRVYAAENDRAEEMAVFVLNQLHTWTCIKLGIDGYDPPNDAE